MFAHEPGAGRQQHRPDVGGDRARDADHRADGRHLPHPRGAGGGLEVLHPRQRRHRARAVRHHPRLHGGAAGGRRGPGRDGVDHAGRATPANFDPALLNVAFVFLLLGYGTKVGLAPLHAWLPDAHAEGPTPISAVLSGLLLNVALYAVLRFKMLLAANPAALAPGPLMVTMGLVSLVFAALHALPPARHQAHVRLLLDRAHGHHRLRLRHGRAARQFRRPAAHGDAQPDQVGDLLRRRPHRPGQGHAADRRDPRPHRDPSGARLGPGGRRRRDRRPAAARRLHERVPGRQLDLRPRAAAGDPAGRSGCWSPSARCSCGCNGLAFGEPTRAAPRRSQASYVPMYAHLALVLVGRHLSAAARWSPGSSTSRGCSDERRRRCRHSSTCIAGDRRGRHRPWPRVVVDAAAWRRPPTRSRAAGCDAARPVGRAGAVHMALLDREAGEIAVVSLDCPTRRLSLGRRGCIRRPSGSNARSATCSASMPEGAPDDRPWLDHGRWGVRHPLGAAEAGCAAPATLPVPAGRRRGPAPDPGRAGPCRHHRARPFPLHRQWRDGGAPGGAARLCPQGHRGPDGAAPTLERAARARRPHLRRQHRRLCARLRAGRRGGARRRGAAARASGCAR